MLPSKPGTDLRLDLLPSVMPYVSAAIALLEALGLIGKWADRFWPLILGIAAAQALGSAVAARVARRWQTVSAQRATIGLWNWIAMTLIVIIDGGYPSPFWLIFLLGSIISGLMTDQIGLYLNVTIAALALTAPLLPSGISLQAATGIGMQLVALLLVGLVVRAAAERQYNAQSKHRQAEEALQQSNERLVSLVTQLELHTREIGLQAAMGAMLHSCTTFEEICGVMGSYMQQLFPSETGALFTYSASRNELEAQYTWGAFPTESDARIFTPDECWALRQGQIYRWDASQPGLRCWHAKQLTSAQYLCVPMMARGEALGVLHVRIPAPSSTIETVTALAASVAEYIALALANHVLRETLRNQAIRDSLTGLFNRRYAEETLEREIHRAERAKRPLAVITFDIDHFKLFNDTYGHDCGDVVLQGLGAFLSAHVRGDDVACRYGGEEFMLIMAEVSLEAARQRAEALREAAKSLSLAHKGQPLGKITLSFGVSAFPEIGTTRETLLRTADAALYRAKAEGRDRVVAAEASADWAEQGRMPKEHRAPGSRT